MYIRILNFCQFSRYKLVSQLSHKLCFPLMIRLRRLGIICVYVKKIWHDIHPLSTILSVQYNSVNYTDLLYSSVQSLSHVRLFATPWITQHARPPCPSPTPGVHSDPHPSSQWCHPAISSSVVPFSSSVVPYSSCPQSLPASESFPIFTWGGQSTGVSALVSFLSKFFNGG